MFGDAAFVLVGVAMGQAFAAICVGPNTFLLISVQSDAFCTRASRKMVFFALVSNFQVVVVVLFVLFQAGVFGSDYYASRKRTDVGKWRDFDRKWRFVQLANGNNNTNLSPSSLLLLPLVRLFS